MYELSPEELLLIARIIAHVMGNKDINLTDLDKETAKMLLKKMTDQRIDWTPGQKGQLKELIDAVA